MGGKKGKSGRPRKFNDEYHRVCRELSRKYYYENKEERAKSMKKYHEKNVEIMKYAKKHGLSIPEARKILGEKRKEPKE